MIYEVVNFIDVDVILCIVIFVVAWGLTSAFLSMIFIE